MSDLGTTFVGDPLNRVSSIKVEPWNQTSKDIIIEKNTSLGIIFTIRHPIPIFTMAYNKQAINKYISVMYKIVTHVHTSISFDSMCSISRRSILKTHNR